MAHVQKAGAPPGLSDSEPGLRSQPGDESGSSGGAPEELSDSEPGFRSEPGNESGSSGAPIPIKWICCVVVEEVL